MASKFEKPSVTVDVLLFTIEEETLKILLIKRRLEPFLGSWALPGGFVRMKEDLDSAARRELEEESGVSDVYLEQLYTFGQPDRDPRTRVITITYMALAASQKWRLKAASDAVEAKLFSIDELPSLAFDHQQIIEYGLARLRAKLGYTNIAMVLLPDEFSLTQLQKVYEIILKTKLDKRNFRKKILNSGLLVSTDKKTEKPTHRPARLYRFGEKKLIVTD